MHTAHSPTTAGKQLRHSAGGQLGEYLPAQILAELEPGERLIWSERPSSWRYAAHYLPQLIMGCVFAALASWQVFWKDWEILLALRFDDLASMLHFGLWFALLIVGVRSIFTGLRALISCRNVVYALTDRRLIVAEDRQKPQSFSAKAFEKMRRTGGRRGTIWFDYGSDGDSSSYRHALFGIPDAEGVEQLLRRQFPPIEKRESSWRPFG